MNLTISEVRLIPKERNAYRWLSKISKKQLENLLIKGYLLTPKSSSVNMDEFQKSKMAKAKSLVKNEMYKWYDWLIIHTREKLKVKKKL